MGRGKRSENIKNHDGSARRREKNESTKNTKITKEISVLGDLVRVAIDHSLYTVNKEILSLIVIWVA